MQFASRAPSARLAPFVSQLWYFEGGTVEHSRERRLTSTAMQVVVNLDGDRIRWWDGPELSAGHTTAGAAVSGVYLAPFAIDTGDQRRVAGAVFRPGAAAPLLGVPADALADSHVELEALWKADAQRTRARLAEADSPAAALAVFDDALCGHISGEIDPLARFACASLEQGRAVASVAREAGLGPKRFRQRFSAAVGLPPKAYARIERLQRLLAHVTRATRPDWAALAVDCGYYDQAHLIREFRCLTGLTPSSYRPRTPDAQNHVAF